MPPAPATPLPLLTPALGISHSLVYCVRVCVLSVFLQSTRRFGNIYSSNPAGYQHSNPLLPPPTPLCARCLYANDFAGRRCCEGVVEGVRGRGAACHLSASCVLLTHILLASRVADSFA